MSIRRTAKKGDFKRAATSLEQLGGEVSGTPRSIMAKLGFDGSWQEFRIFMDANVCGDNELGRYVVKSATNTKRAETVAQSVDLSMSPEIFAMCASSYVLGEGDEKEFHAISGPYARVTEVVEALAIELDDTIGGMYLPPVSKDMSLYKVERELIYASSNDTFRVYGAHILEAAA